MRPRSQRVVSGPVTGARSAAVMVGQQPHVTRHVGRSDRNDMHAPNRLPYPGDEGKKSALGVAMPGCPAHGA